MYLSKTTVLFTFSYRHGCYAVTEAERGLLDCQQISWNLWRGFYASKKELSDEILDVYSKLVDLQWEPSEKYKFHGAHYTVSRVNDARGERLKIAVSPTYVIKGGRYWCPLLIRLAFFLTVSFFLCRIFSPFITLWWEYLFPHVRISPQTLKGILYATEMGGTGLIFFWIGKHRPLLYMYCYSIIPLGTLVLLGVMKRWFFIALLVPILLALIYNCSRLFYPNFSFTSRKKSKTFLFCNSLCSLALVAILTVSILNITPYTGYQSVGNVPATEELCERYRQACEELCEFDREEKSLQEKLDILQAICDYECIVVFGCTESPTVQAGKTDRETVLGYYVDLNRTITIRSEHLEDGDTETILCTLLHEIRHYMQYRTVELYVSLKPHIGEAYVNMSPFREALLYLDNFNHYHSGTDDYELYYNQAVEEDSREWAEKQIEKYFFYIYP